MIVQPSVYTEDIEFGFQLMVCVINILFFKQCASNQENKISRCCKFLFEGIERLAEEYHQFS